MQTFRLVAALALAAACGAALAQAAYPAKPITLLIPFPPGTGNDVIGRAYAVKMAEGLGQPIVADNRAGASGNIAAEAAAKAASDGYTLFCGSGSFTLNMHLSKLNFDLSNFAGISMLGQMAYTLSVPASLPARSVAELVKLAKAKPGVLSGATGGNSTAGYFLLESLNKAAGVEIVPVAYKGTPEAVPDLLAGRVHVLFSLLATSLPLHQGGKAPIIGITGAKRSAVLPDVATFTESGFPMLDMPSWFALLAPAATPRPVITRLNAEAVKAAHLKDVQDQLNKLGVDPGASTPAELDAFLKADYAKWGKAVADSGVSAR